MLYVHQDLSKQAADLKSPYVELLSYPVLGPAMPTPLNQFLKQKVYKQKNLITHSTSTEKSIYGGTDYFERIWWRLKKGEVEKIHLNFP